MFLYQKGNFESMRKDAYRTLQKINTSMSVQENFDLITSFIQESADKHIPSKTSRSTSSVPLITLR